MGRNEGALVAAAAMNEEDASSQGKIVIDLRVPDHEKVKILSTPQMEIFLYPISLNLFDYLSRRFKWDCAVRAVVKTGCTVNFMVFCIMIVNIYAFTYSCLSFVPWLCNITVRGEAYGVTQWMKQPRWAPACYASPSCGW